MCTRNKITARRFGSADLSALVNIAKYMYTLFEYKTKYQEEVAKIKSMLFQAIASYTLRKSEKKLIIPSGITLNQRNHFAEG